MKHLAVQLFGHLRTFEKTFNSFYNNVVKPNEDAGYSIDIFIHTWDEFECTTQQWHNCNLLQKGKKYQIKI